MAALYIKVVTGEWVWLRARAGAAAAIAQTGSDQTRQKLFSYLGYGFRPGWVMSEKDATQVERIMGLPRGARYLRWPANNLGFFAPADYPTRRSPDEFVVGIFGGSVASAFALVSQDDLAAELKPIVQGRKVTVLNFANGGTKQPQHLLTLAYMLSIGQQLDLIITLDGFNEVYSAYGNWQMGVDYSQPYASFLFGLQNHFISAEAAQRLDRRRMERARWDRLSHTTRSAIVALVSEALRPAEAADVQIENEVGQPVAGRDYPIVVPSRRLSEDDLFKEISANWASASIMMSELARQSGAKYLHVLQPNQYIGHHEFSADERRVAFGDGHWSYSDKFGAGYDGLKAAASRVERAGVAFVDATPAFDRYREPIYIDTCCHVNKRGYDILLGDAIVPKLRSLYGLAPREARSN